MEILILLGYAGYVDYKRRSIPNEIVLVMYLCAIFFSSASVIERIAGCLIPALPLFLLALQYKELKGGDIKYLSAIGAYFGITASAAILAFTTVTAVLWSVIKKEKRVPLALFIVLGYVMYFIWKECG